MGGGIELIRTLNDLGLESEIPDFIARSESAKNDLFSKFRLHSIYGVNFDFTIKIYLLYTFSDTAPPKPALPQP